LGVTLSTPNQYDDLIILRVIRDHMSVVIIPHYWQTFLHQNRLAGQELSIPTAVDLSGVGAEIEILDEQGILQEQTEAYPGICVSGVGFVPIGICGIGTGDPYFINLHDGAGGPLYRIYHDEVNDENYAPPRAVVIVLEDYRELLKYVKT
jgi:hypothetical protein